MNSAFKILSEIRDIETIAAGRGVHIRRYLERAYGQGRWRKLKGIATVELVLVQYVGPRYTGTKHVV